VDLLQAYASLISDIYRPEAYFERVNRALELRPRTEGRFSLPWAHAAACLLRSILRQGVFGNYRGAYWRYLWRVMRNTPHRIARAISMAIAGEHMIRYTAEDVLPRLAQAIAQVSGENASREKVAA
jgi:hypothetical protein